jgi:hypothetical protein
VGANGRFEVVIVHPDVDQFGWLDAGWDQFTAPELDGRSWSEQWEVPVAEALEPKLMRPRFWSLYGTANYAADEATLDAAGLRSGEPGLELLPVDVEDGERLWLVNVLGPVDYLDERETEWRRGVSGGIIERPTFIQQRFRRPSLFKLPFDWRVNLYSWSGAGEPSFVDLASAIPHHGLLFDHVWDSAQGGSRPHYLPQLPEEIAGDERGS